jgi:hypothetical protein
VCADGARAMLEKMEGVKAEEALIKVSALSCSGSLGQVLIIRITQSVLEKQK